MDIEAALQQAKFENEMLTHIKAALRVVIAWSVEEKEFSRKLSSLRFITQSLYRHVDRMMALEEIDGYMALLPEAGGQDADRIGALQREHEAIRVTMRRIMPRMDRVSPSDRDALDSLCGDILSLLQAIDDHDVNEQAFLADVFPA